MKANLILFLCLSYFSTYFANAQENKNNIYLKEYYEQKLNKYLAYDQEIKTHIEIGNSGVAVYASAQDRQIDKIEYYLSWNELAVFRALVKQNVEQAYQLYQNKESPETLMHTLKKPDYVLNWDMQVFKPLTNVRIALDPGHVGGDMETAKMEWKYIEMDLGYKKIAFYEADLTLSTAKILKMRLESLGATVMLTRNDPHSTAFGITFDQWFETNKAKFKKMTNESEKQFKSRIFYDEFRLKELAERAKIINRFRPDLTLIIHYNVDGANDPWNRPTEKNFNMAFIGGGFLKNELKEKEDRFHFLRLLLSDDIENSLSLSQIVLQSFEKNLKVPTDPSTNYPKSLTTDAQGVYARNLTLTRRVNGVLCYGESLFQDNIKECQALSEKNIEIAGVRTSQRVVEVADAYFEAIINYIKAQ
ncbi:MAG: hypothetical protein EAZ55_08340 [Cytophagales bacterium]|nr:MAG: hypothetical protein EAZ55_08340 [Cytophagales bacterium]